jgi:hypothetical protein
MGQVEQGLNSFGESVGIALIAFGAGWLLGGDWQHGLGALFVQMLVVHHVSAFTQNLARMAQFLKK